MVEHFKTAVQNALLTATHEHTNFDPYAEATAIISAVEDAPPPDRITLLPSTGGSQAQSSPLSANSSPDASKAQYLHKQLPSSSSSAAGALGASALGDEGENAYLSTNRHAGWKRETTVQFHQIQRMMEAIDALKVLNGALYPYFPTLSYPSLPFPTLSLPSLLFSKSAFRFPSLPYPTLPLYENTLYYLSYCLTSHLFLTLVSLIAHGSLLFANCSLLFAHGHTLLMMIYKDPGELGGTCLEGHRVMQPNLRPQDPERV